VLSLLDVIKRTTDYLRKAGLETPRLDAELLIGHALGFSRTQLYLQFERPLAEDELAKLRPLVRRRAQREPLQYILGEVEFLGLRLKVDRRALVPRPETEELADLLVRRFSPRRILDLGTGTGALALALASAFPEAEVTAVDRSSDALSLARENSAVLGLERVMFLESDWFSQIPPGRRPFDLVVSNPPYLTEEEWETAQPEVREFEPRQALVAAGSGRADLERILRETPQHLLEGGWLALETGVAQHAALFKVAEEAGFSTSESLRDMSGRERFFLAQK
jgi:release factor glutamine methyltransferase